MDSKTHRTRVNGECPYPDLDFILSQLGEIKLIRVGGFHAFDCVERLAKRAYERGLDSLVDEELTQFFPMSFQHPDFQFEACSLVRLKKLYGDKGFEKIMRLRKDKPWLWGDQKED